MSSVNSYPLVSPGAGDSVLGIQGGAVKLFPFGFVQSGAGAVSRTAQDKARDVVSVLDYGADPTGVQDSAAAIQAAIDSNPKGGIRLGRGNFLASSARIRVGGASLIGDGQKATIRGLVDIGAGGSLKNVHVLVNSTDFPAWAGESLVTMSAGAAGAQITDNKIELAVSDATLYGTKYLVGSDNAGVNIDGLRIARNEITAPSANICGVKLYSSVAVSGITVEDNNIHDVGYLGCEITSVTSGGVSDIKVLRNTFKHCGHVRAALDGMGLSLANSAGMDGVLIDGNTFDDNYGYSLEFAIGSALNTLNAKVVNNTFKNLSHNHAIRASGGGLGVVTGAIVAQNTFQNIVSPAMPLVTGAAINNSSISGNTLNGSTGFSIGGKHNTIVGNNASEVSGFFCNIDGGVGNLVTGNRQFNADLSTISYLVGINNNTSLRNVVTGNFSNLATAGIECLLTGTAAPVNDFLNANTNIVRGNFFSGQTYMWESKADPLHAVTYHGDAAYGFVERASTLVQVWNVPLTADRAMTLGNGSINGLTVHVVRTSTATSSFNLNVGALKALSPGQWCDVTWDGSAWFLSNFGSL